MTDYTSDILNGTMYDTVVMTSHTNQTDFRWCPEKKDEEGDEFYETARFVTGLIIYPAVCIPGIIGNALTIFVMSRRNMHSSTNAFLSALAVADTIKLLNDLLYFFVILFSRISDQLGNLSYGYLYPYAHFVFNLSVCVSSWLTVSVAVERYILVCHPTRARSVWSRKRAVLLCTSIYVIMTTVALPSALRYRTFRCRNRETNATVLEVELTELWKIEEFVEVYLWTQNLLRSIIPLLVLILLNACIISALRRTKGKRRKNSRHRITIMMIVIILAFLVCITPDAILSTVFGVGYHEADYLARGIREITDTLLAVNASINFLIYCAFNQVFRKSFVRICCPNTRQSTWMTELEESTYRRLSEAKSLLSSNNNSPPRQDTPPTVMTDHSPSGNNCLGYHGSDSRAMEKSDDNYDDGDSASNSRHSGLGQMTQGESSLTPNTTYSQHLQPYPHNQNNHHPHRNSNGLKKSKNSIKCNRAKNRGNVVTFSNSVNVYRRDQTEAKTQELNDIDKEDSSETAPTPKDVNETTNGKKTGKYCKSSPIMSAKLQNNLTNNVPEKITTDPCKLNDSSLSDAEQLANFRNCDGTLVSSSVRDSECGISSSTPVIRCSKDVNVTNSSNTSANACLKNNLRNGKKKCRISVSFIDTSVTDLESGALSKGDNTSLSNVSGHKGNNQYEAPVTSPEEYSEIAGANGKAINVNGNVPTPIHTICSYLKADILTTDL